jgi:hypothetical protein
LRKEDLNFGKSFTKENVKD